MLRVYGSLMPLRVLEEIRFWKMQEREHTIVIRELAPALEAPYVALLQQWEGTFGQTEAAAQQWIETVVRLQPPLSPYIDGRVRELLQVAVLESGEFIRQLFMLMEHSAPIKASPVIKTVVMHIIRESEYFLGVLQAAQQHEPDSVMDGLREQAFGPAAPTAFFSEDSAEDASYVPNRPEDDEPMPLNASAEADRSSELTATQEGLWSLGTAPNVDSAPVPIGGHRLPALPYAYNALEPYIDTDTMRLHHDKHHQTYVDGLNKAEKKLAEARESGDYDLIKHWSREAAFHGAGHYLHTIFWESMKPGGGGKATGDIAGEIKRSFGSFDAFRKQFGAAADKVEGGGWAILVWSPRSHLLELLQAEKHQNLSQWDVIPLLPLDVWEHAYYLKYKNARGAYIEAWWNTVNWDRVNERFNAARQLKWLPY
ncbi:Fe-Mn family superoxide dismutase [Paenibacillus allorhizosphaerae]|uniref:superoxide dismutase n=1 Tax=Paenibacillus allorhizosphaerae TaxID=2849866 RepID=A0ABM8VMC0_9BACL|nr:Fe-Mn family superoxide dismutase [Paenibacillus allorhizosphaerae]CAG7649748.1 hypothetical protein PAECIP111802_04546 [Paenibacillus allorhizosphaerae]